MNLPIAERELRVAARSPRIYRGRLVAGLIFGVMTGWLLWATRGVFTMNHAGTVYGVMTNFALMMCMFASSATADSISSEKRAGTLGFLFLTDLKGVDVVFGKLAASGLMSMYGLLAIIPMISMPVLMGGVGGESLFRSAITLVNAMFFSLSLGLWISARSWDQKKVMGASAWVTILFLFGLPGFAALLEYRFGLMNLATALKVFSPAYQLQNANPLGIGLTQQWYWTSVSVTHVLGWLALWSACRTVPNAWQDRPTPMLGRMKGWWERLKFGTSEERTMIRKSLLNRNAVHWLTARERLLIASTWSFIGIILALWVGLWISINSVPRNRAPFWPIGIPMVVIISLGLRMRAFALASEVLARDRFSGALELLLSTSLSIEDVTRGIWMSIRRVLLKPVLTTLFIGATILVFIFAELDDEAGKILLVFVCLNIWFLLDLIAGVWTAMWMACVAKQPNGPAGLTLLRLVLLPFLLFFVVLSIFGFFNARWFLNEFPYVFLTWFGICVANSIFWMRRSRRKFHEQLRLVAAERYQPPPPPWRWWRFWEWGQKSELGHSQ